MRRMIAVREARPKVVLGRSARPGLRRPGTPRRAGVRWRRVASIVFGMLGARGGGLLGSVGGSAGAIGRSAPERVAVHGRAARVVVQWLRNSILTDNVSTNPWDQALGCESTMAGDHNIQWPAPATEGDASCTADILLVDPLLGALSDNGGPTQTIPLLEGSPAIDAAEGCSATDQRGEPRGAACDIGAFEVQ